MEERMNVCLYNRDGHIIKAFYDVDKFQINDNGWVYIRKNGETFIYNKDIIGIIELDNR